MAEIKNTDDLLGYSDYAHTLWARILAALNCDAANAKLQKEQQLLGDDPLVVGIFGEWGAGKSRLLQLIHQKAERTAKERFTAHQGDSGLDLTVPVFFQPWKYEHEPHLLVPLLMHILAELNQSLELSKGLEESVKQKFDQAGDELVKAMPNLVQSVGKLFKSVAAKFATVDATGTAIGLALAGALATFLAKEKKPIQKNAEEFSFEDNGRSYYEIHEILKHITRPKTHKYTHPNHKIDQDIRINFVIFIDDLDRCLPEKAVETLELIKTIFNAESFAFVLALDEEVVERGIGHRYKDYTLVGKKPEMPITGFEYLEKIVHLPFRLPALTQAQALNFLACYEEKLISQRHKNANSREKWFVSKKIEITGTFKDIALQKYQDGQTTEDFSSLGDDALERNIDNRQKALRGMTGVESINLNLAALVIGSFNAFVPRKLIRVVELFHQVLDVLDQRGTSASFCIGGDLKKTIDPRIALANILLQLFQPDLQRTLRRSKTGFDVLLQAFTPQTTSGNMQLSSVKSDADLLHWAIFKNGEKPPISIRAATLRLADLDEGRRYASQRQLLVIVERLLEHRSIQRHAFDPLKLFETLQNSTRNSSIPLPDETRWMSAMLATTTDTMGESTDADLPVLSMNHYDQIKDTVILTSRADMVKVNAAGDVKNPPKTHNRTNAKNIDSVFLALISPQDLDQKGIAETAGVKVGDVLSRSDIEFLVEACHQRYFNGSLPNASNADKAEIERTTRLMRGLIYLAPYIAQEDGEKLWNLVKDRAAVDNKADPKLRAQWYDVRAALGQDVRFQGKLALAKREKGDADEAPDGFIKIEKGTYYFGDENVEKKHEYDYYISRYCVTVAQYAAFIDSPENNSENFWRDHVPAGMAWRFGKFQTKTDDKFWKDYLARRPQNLRHQPMDWAEQHAYPHRPVTGVSWFEATAYAAWLEKHRSAWLAGEKYIFNDGILPWSGYSFPDQLLKTEQAKPKYRLRLPVEDEWERAAKSSKAQKFPWGDTDANIDQLANVNHIVGSATTVGSYPPNELGLYDMAGNVWQWQANAYSEPYKRDLIKLSDTLTEGERVSLRGGSWDLTSDVARCSCRSGVHPDGWNYDLGFRLVLSLADL